MEKKIYGVITTSENITHVYKLQENLYKSIYSNFKNFYIINLSNFKLINKKKKIIKKIPSYIKYFHPKKYLELKNFFKNKKLILFNGIGRTINFYLILFLLKKFNTKIVMLLNLTSIGNKQSDSHFSIKDMLIKNYKKLDYIVFRFLTLVGMFPKIELYFDCDKNNVNRINEHFLSSRINKLFNFLDLKYYKKAILVGNREQKAFLNKNKYISFIDSNFYHKDRILREANPSLTSEKEYFKKIILFLEKIRKLYNLKLIICLHPTSNYNLYKKYFKKYKLIKSSSFKIISQSKVCFFHESSLIIDALNISKPIVLLKSGELGNYISYRIDKYIKKFKLLNFNVDQYKLESSILKKKINFLINYKKNYKKKIDTNFTIINQLRKL
jgi:hypothetical protein